MLIVLKSGNGHYIGEDGKPVDDMKLAHVYDVPDGADGMNVPEGFEPVSLYAEMKHAGED